MGKLQEIREKTAEDLEFKNWDELRSFLIINKQEKSLDEIERDVIATYTEECCKATLKQASKNALLRVTSSNSDRNHKNRVDTINGLWGTFNETATVNKESITNPENIVLL